MFYGFYNDFVTLPVLGQTSNFGSLGSSVKELFNYKIILAFADIIVFFVLLKKMKNFAPTERVARPMRSLYFVSTVAIFFANLGLAEAERPELLTRSFDALCLLKLRIICTPSIRSWLTSKIKFTKAFADGSKLQETENYVKQHKVNQIQICSVLQKGKT